MTRRGRPARACAAGGRPDHRLRRWPAPSSAYHEQRGEPIAGRARPPGGLRRGGRPLRPLPGAGGGAGGGDLRPREGARRPRRAGAPTRWRRWCATARTSASPADARRDLRGPERVGFGGVKADIFVSAAASETLDEQALERLAAQGVRTHRLRRQPAVPRGQAGRHARAASGRRTFHRGSGRGGELRHGPRLQPSDARPGRRAAGGRLPRGRQTITQALAEISERNDGRPHRAARRHPGLCSGPRRRGPEHPLHPDGSPHDPTQPTSPPASSSSSATSCSAR